MTDTHTIQSARAAYSYQMASLLAGCCRLSYLRFERSKEDNQELTSQLAKMGLKLWDVLVASDTQAYLAWHQDFVVVVFRGTQYDDNDALHDLDIRLCLAGRRYSSKVHQGFLRAYQQVADRLDVVLAYAKKPVYVTGHSLGGALAVLACYYLRQQPVHACYTFGAPRVGNREFCVSWGDIPVYRHVHAADIVPHVPLLSLGYSHIGDVRYITKAGDVIIAPLSLWVCVCLWMTLLRGFHLCLQDHAIVCYEQKLLEWSSKPQEEPVLPPARKKEYLAKRLLGTKLKQIIAALLGRTNMG